MIAPGCVFFDFHGLASFPSVILSISTLWSSNMASWQIAHLIFTYRGKFRNQISDNMDRWKSRGGKSQRREVTKKENQRREKESEEKRCRCAKKESRETLRFSNGLWLRRVDK